MRRVLWLPLVFLSATSLAVRPQAKIDTEQMVRQTIEGERDCLKEDWNLAFLAQSTGVLKSDSLPTRTCRAVTLEWCSSAKVVQLTGVQHQDVFVSISIVRANEESPIRLVRALGGLVQNRDLEDEQANKAVFNGLLRECRYRPREDQMLEVAALYLFMVGHPHDDTPRKLSQIAMISDMLGTTEKKGKWSTVTVHQRHSSFGPFGNPSRNWILKFHDEKLGVWLASVTPE
jgi:hypothetical protein